MIFIIKKYYKNTIRMRIVLFLVTMLYVTISKASFFRGAKDYIPLDETNTYFISYKDDKRQDILYKDGR